MDENTSIDALFGALKKLESKAPTGDSHQLENNSTDFSSDKLASLRGWQRSQHRRGIRKDREESERLT